MSVAIITGASSGLGREYVSAVIEKRPEIDEIWVIARREERLQALVLKYPRIKIVPIPMDLTLEESYAKLGARLREQKPNIQLLISNAGVGKVSNFDQLPLTDAMNMINLNCKAYVAVTRLCLDYMRPGAEIIEVSSMASFCPNTRMSLYGGTKALVRAWSTGIREELKPRGIKVLTVCPGNMDTEFFQVSGLAGNTSFDGGIPWLSVPKIARESLDYVSKGKMLYLSGAFYKIYYVMTRLLPRELMIKLAKE